MAKYSRATSAITQVSACSTQEAVGERGLAGGMLPMMRLKIFMPVQGLTLDTLPTRRPLSHPYIGYTELSTPSWQE